MIPLPKLHAITNDTVLSLPDFHDRLAAIAAGGPVAIHLRSAALPIPRLMAVADSIRASGATLFVNDRIDLALAVDADGIHLPEHGLPTDVARRFGIDGRWVGRSTHTPTDADEAIRTGADYAFLGPIFPTASHVDANPLGIQALARCREQPIIAIGGVTQDTAARCRAHGAFGIAAITALWNSPDPTATTRAMLVSLEDKWTEDTHEGVDQREGA